MPLPRVLMIGGPPSSGKTTVAQVLAQRDARSVVSTDDLRIAIHVALHGLQPEIAEDHREYFLERTVDRLWQEELDRLRSTRLSVDAVAGAHAHAWGANPAIVEGCAVLPSDTEQPNIGRVSLIPSGTCSMPACVRTPHSWLVRATKRK